MASEQSPALKPPEAEPPRDQHAAISEPVLTNVAAATPAELLAQHVQRVVDGNDIQKISGYGRHLGRPVIPVALGGGIAEAAYTLARYGNTSTPAFTAASVWMGATGLVALAAGSVYKRHQRKSFERNNGIALQQRVGHAYELYNMSVDGQEAETRNEPERPIVTMHWHGPLVDKGTPEDKTPSFLQSVRSITRLAKQAGVSHLFVDQDTLVRGLPDSELAALPTDPSRLGDHEAFLGSIGFGNTAATVKGDAKIRVFGVDEFRRAVEKALGISELDSLVEALGEVTHNDPLVGTYQRLLAANADEMTIRQAVKSAATTALDRNLHVDSRIQERTSSQDPTRSVQRTEPSARVTNGRVRVTHTLPDGRQVVENAGILESIGLSDREIAASKVTAEQRIAAKEQASVLLTPHQKKLAYYYRLYELTHVPDENKPPTDGKPVATNPVIASANNLLQQALVDTALSKTRWRKKIVESATGAETTVHMRRRTVRRLILAGAAACLVLPHYMVANAIEEDTLTAMRHGSPESTYEDFQRKAIAENGILGSAVVRLQQGEDAITNMVANGLTDTLAPHVPSSWLGDNSLISRYRHNPADSNLSDLQDSPSDGGSSVGNNNPNERNSVQWYLNPHDMDTSGYWGTSTSHELRYTSWTTEQGAEEAFFPPQNVPSGETSYTEVTRTLSADNPYILLPVLEGTEVVAANHDGERVRLLRGANGAYTAELANDNPNGKLTYYVAPRNDADRLHATERAKLVGADEAGMDLLRKKWKTLLPDRAADEARRINQETAYIRSNFEYSLTPFSSKDYVDNADSIALAALHNEKANCNVAATTLITDNPSLNLATGWRNSNDSRMKQQILSAHEAHAWTVDAAGTIHDATPTGGGGQYAAYFDETTAYKPDAAEQDYRSADWKLVGTGALLAFAAYRRRRQITRMSQAVASNTLDAVASLSYAAVRTPGHAGYVARAATEAPYMRRGTPTQRRQQFEASIDRLIERREPGSAPLDTAQIGSIRQSWWDLRYMGVSRRTRVSVGLQLAARKFLQSRDR